MGIKIVITTEYLVQTKNSLGKAVFSSTYFNDYDEIYAWALIMILLVLILSEIPRLAMKFLENKKTDLILLDYEMPGESGPDVFRILRENKSTRKVPIVFLTGVDDMQKVQEVLKLKPQGYLLKPIDHDKLISTIEGLLDK